MTSEHIKGVTLQVNGSFFYSRSKSYHDAEFASNEGFAWTAGGSITYRLPTKTQVQVSSVYQSLTPLPQFNIEPVWYTNIGVRQRLLNERLSLSLLITDVLDQRRWHITTRHPHFSIENHSKPVSRVVWIGLTYTMSGYRPVADDSPGQREEDRAVIRTGQ